MKYGIVVLISLLAIVSSCKKNKGDTPSGGGALSEATKIKDTTIAYTRDIYLWYKQIPSSFKARDYAGPEEIMEAIRKYSTEPGFNAPVDRWSFAIKQTEWDNVSGGIAQDFGINVFFRVEGDLRVRRVEPNSPAGMAGIKRGWRITKINGNSNILTSNADFIIDKVYYSASTTFTFLKPDDTTVEITLNAGIYESKQLLLDTVYAAGTKKVGYMVYNSFLGDSAKTHDGFQRIFNRFSTENVDDVVIDLRYNGGGYVAYQNELANYLVPASANNALMMKTVYNDKYSQYNQSINFKKKGTLNLPRIFFIVSNSTASASELLINNLKPYIGQVYIVGPSATYGKPVGYFAIPVADWYIFPVSSRTVNKNNEGNYFNGFTLNKQVPDGVDKEMGDIGESCLATVLSFINTGNFRTSRTEQPLEENLQIKQANEKMTPKAFNGMILERTF